MEERADSQHKIRAGEMEWTNYHTLEEMYAWIDELLVKYPNILSLEQVGTSYQGREIRAVKLSHKPVGFKKKIVLRTTFFYSFCVCFAIGKSSYYD